MGLVEVAAALLTLVIVLSASVHNRSDAPPLRSVQVAEATLHAAHLLHADSPWVGQSLNDHFRIQAPSEDGLEASPRLAHDPVEEAELQTPISAARTDRPSTLRDLSEAVHPDRTHAPPFLS
jgi:hypothetical protein